MSRDEDTRSGHHIGAMNRLLADATVFVQQLRNFHWMVTGPQFFVLHAKFEELYRKWADHGDALAERILMLGGTPVRTLAAVLAETSLTESAEELSAKQMLEKLLDDMSLLERSMHSLIVDAETADDRGTVVLLDDIRSTTEQDMWMLRAALDARG